MLYPGADISTPIFSARSARSCPINPSRSSACAVVSNGNREVSHLHLNFSGGNSACFPAGLNPFVPFVPTSCSLSIRPILHLNRTTSSLIARTPLNRDDVSSPIAYDSTRPQPRTHFFRPLFKSRILYSRPSPHGWSQPAFGCRTLLVLKGCGFRRYQSHTNRRPRSPP